jgi:hypothetical protein
VVIAGEVVVMDSSTAARAQIQSELMSLMSTMFVKAYVLAKQELVMVGELYVTENKGTFGITYFN